MKKNYGLAKKLSDIQQADDNLSRIENMLSRIKALVMKADKAEKAGEVNELSRIQDEINKLIKTIDADAESLNIHLPWLNELQEKYLMEDVFYMMTEEENRDAKKWFVNDMRKLKKIKKELLK
ncbi:MAG: hypothetical protein FWF03_07700 [Defluviitaleaceae bacterium]|nr:hypothetical protein [Defluviitaleaceae bacterium]